MGFVINPFTGQFDFGGDKVSENPDFKKIRDIAIYNLNCNWLYNAVIGFNSGLSYSHYSITERAVKENERITIPQFMIIRNNYILGDNYEYLNLSVYRNGQLLYLGDDYSLSITDKEENNYSEMILRAFDVYDEKEENPEYYKMISCTLIITLNGIHKDAEMKEFKLSYQL